MTPGLDPNNAIISPNIFLKEKWAFFWIKHNNPTHEAFNPLLGDTPAKNANAILSGTCANAIVKPANISVGAWEWKMILKKKPNH